MNKKKKIWFFRYDTWIDAYMYLPMTWFEFKRYYELNGKYPDDWEWIKPPITYRDWSVDNICEEAISHNADVYMFSSYMWNWEIVKVVASAIKDALPNAVVVIGGPHQNTTYTDPMFWFKDHPYIDATSQPLEYGEYFITDMLDQISEGNLNWANVRNSYHRRGKGPTGAKTDFKYPTEIIGHNIEFCREIRDYAKEHGFVMALMYETNRGCMYKCTYCEWGGGTGTKLIIKDMDNIKDDISYFRELNIHTVWITDANYGILKRDPEISELLATQTDYMQFVGITGLAKAVTEKRRAVLEPLIKSGLVNLYQVSLQSIDPKVLENIERTDIPPEENLALAKYFIEKYDIDVIVELILGLPGFKLDTYYEETELEYLLVNSAKPHTHHVPLYVLPDSPIGNPEYIKKHKMQLVPIAIDESVSLMRDESSKYIKQFKDKNFKKEYTLYIPVESETYTKEEWREMFFMNDMSFIFINMIMIKPFVDVMYHHYGILPRESFRKLFKSLANVPGFWEPVHDYLTKISNGEYGDNSWRELNVGPITGTWSIYAALLWLWCSNKKEIYKSIRTEFANYIDERLDDCLTYCENSTFGESQDVSWESKWRWDRWEETNNPKLEPVKEPVKLLTKYSSNINWKDKAIVRPYYTVREETNDPIKIKVFKLKKE